jgi:Ca2+-binding EF-hand superfamily protein
MSETGKSPGDEPTREIREAFDLFDIDHDGGISGHDLRIALNSLGFEFNSSEIQRLIMEMDPGNTGKIDFQNFAELIHSKMAEREQIDQLQMAFDMLDDDHTGKISFKNLKKVAKELGENLTEQEIHEMINEADTDNDGEICFDEFVALVRTASFS